jgi:hypothetical protein
MTEMDLVFIVVKASVIIAVVAVIWAKAQRRSN